MKQSNQKIYANDGNPDILASLEPSAKYILDIGCGNGANARRLIGNNCIVDGITISEIEQAEAQQYMRTVYVYNLENGLPMAGENIYDAVICSHVLEHICYPDKLLQDIRKVLKPDGRLVVALPNIMHYKSRWQLLMGNFNYQETGIWDYTHFRWYTFETGKALLERSGFRLIKATSTGELPLNSVFKKILPSSVRVRIFSALRGISKGFFGYQLLYVAKPG